MLCPDAAATENSDKNSHKTKSGKLFRTEKNHKEKSKK